MLPIWTLLFTLWFIEMFPYFVTCYNSIYEHFCLLFCIHIDVRLPNIYPHALLPREKEARNLVKFAAFEVYWSKSPVHVKIIIFFSNTDSSIFDYKLFNLRHIPDHTNIHLVPRTNIIYLLIFWQYLYSHRLYVYHCIFP